MEGKKPTTQTDSIPEQELLETEEMNMTMTFGPGGTGKGFIPGLIGKVPADPYRNDVKYSFSDHAQARLIERTSMEPAEVLRMLEDGAYERLARRIDKGRIYENSRYAGLTLEELRARGVDTLSYCYKHVLIWSPIDQKAFTLIIAVKTRRIVTVLIAEDQENGMTWADKITPEAIRRAQERQAESQIPAELRIRVYARVSWLTATNAIRGKNLTGGGFTKNDLPLEDEVLHQLVEQALEITGNAHDIRLQLISKESGTNLLAEYLLEKDISGVIQVVPA